MKRNERWILALGKAQHRALRFGLTRGTGTRVATTCVDGVRMPYLVVGPNRAGAPVVMIHGFGGDKETWLMSALTMPRDRPCILIDLPGFGRAGAIVPERATPGGQAEALLGFADRLGLTAFHLAGNSMGGGIALRFAADYPQRVRSLTLVGSVGPLVEHSELGLALERGENLLIPESLEQADRMLGLALERPPAVPRPLRLYVASQRIAAAERLHALFEVWRDPPVGRGVPEALESIDIPALVIHGACDRVVHPSTGRALAARLPRATLELMAGIGHVPQLEAPREVAAMIGRHLAAVDHGDAA
jgi:pimeloyl-ACP methyl ester carboxylesterase